MDWLAGLLQEDPLADNDAKTNLLQHHEIAGVLKQYLRDLEEPLMPSSDYDSWKQLGMDTIKSTDDKDMLGAYKTALLTLPKPHLDVLGIMINFLRVVAKESDHNKMTPKNLAVVFGPSFLRSPEGDGLAAMTAMLQDAGAAIKLILYMIVNCDELFAAPSPDAPYPTSSSSSSLLTLVPLQAPAPRETRAGMVRVGCYACTNVRTGMCMHMWEVGGWYGCSTLAVVDTRWAGGMGAARWQLLTPNTPAPVSPQEPWTDLSLTNGYFVWLLLLWFVVMLPVPCRGLAADRSWDHTTKYVHRRTFRPRT